MWQTCKKFWYWHSHIGISKASTGNELHATIVLNKLSSISSIVFLVMFIQDIYLQRWDQCIIEFSVVLLFATIPLSNHYLHVNITKVVFNIIYSLNVFGFVIFFGDVIRTDYSFLFAIVASVLIFERVAVQFIFILFTIGLWIASKKYLESFGPIYTLDATLLDQVSSICLAVISNYILISFYKNEVNKTDTSLRETLNAFQLQNNDLNIANQELERFTFIASHDLKTPIRTIVSFLNLIKRSIDRKDYDALPQYIDFAQKGGLQLQELVSQMLEYSKLNLEQNIETEAIDLIEIIKEISYQLKGLISDKNATIEVKPLPILNVNKFLISSIFKHLIENAILYNNNQNPTVLIRANRKGKHLEIQFEDNGIGIDPQFQSNIFQLFTRLKDKQTENGAGVGLAICKKIMQRIGGSIHVDSQIGKGSIFYLTFSEDNYRCSNNVSEKTHSGTFSNKIVFADT